MSEIIVIGLILFGIIAVLVCIHCGSEYVRGHGSTDANDEARTLRHESERYNGITPHSLFYRFFFRGE